jgi:hypothetical protein
MAKNINKVPGAVIISSEKFADVKLPTMKKDRQNPWVNFGDDNRYPQDTIKMLDRSSKHNAIINGKLTYVFGGGLTEAATASGAVFLKNITPKFVKKIILDIEVHSGAYIECLPKLGGGYRYAHITFSRMRSNEDNTEFYYKKNWINNWGDEAKVYPAFYPGIREVSILFFKEYRPGLGVYPMPSYIAATNYIMADIEVSKHTYGNAKTGFSASKMVSFFNGEPTPEAKLSIEKEFGLKYEGSEGRKTILSFNESKEKAPQVDDLGASDLTKEDFSATDNLITANIFSGHQIPNPMLFGIQTPGKLGGGQEIREAYEIFNNTYAKLKREQVEDIIQFLALCNGIKEEFELIDSPPIGVSVTDNMIAGALTRDEIRERLGYEVEEDAISNSPLVKALNSFPEHIVQVILGKMSDNEIRAIAGLPAVTGGDAAPIVNPATPIVSDQAAIPVNEHIKNLTGRQRQNMLSIIKKYNGGQGTITRDMAAMLLKTGLGLSDDEISTALGEKKTKLRDAFWEMDKVFQETFASNLFDDYGTSRDEYGIINTVKATWEVDDEVKELFAAGKKVGEAEKLIKSYLEENSKAEFETISEALNLPVEVVKKAISNLIRGGEIEAKKGVYKVIKKAIKLPDTAEVKLPSLEVRYSYEVLPGIGKEIKPTTRPFCRKLCELNKLYLRADIEKISQIVGYSVWDRRGGFWRKPDGSTSESCRHYWAMHIVTKK